MSQRSRWALGLCGALVASASPSAFAQSAFSQSVTYSPRSNAAAPQPRPAGAAPGAINLEPVTNLPPSFPQSAPRTGAPVQGMPVQNGPVYYEQAAAPAPAARHTHKGLFGWRHCVECQRARVRSRDGVNVPPPPGRSGMVFQDGTVVEGPIMMSGPTPGSYTIIEPNGTTSPGFAVVGGPSEGYAVAGGAAPGAEPTPVGVSRGAWGNRRMAAAAPRRPGPGPGMGMGAYDPAVLPSSMTPAQTAMSGPGHNRPHVIGHILGFGGLGTRYLQRRDYERRSSHASIAYGKADDKVTELPASSVYGR